MNCIVVETVVANIMALFCIILGSIKTSYTVRRTLILLGPLVAKLLRLKILQKVNDKILQILTLEISYVHHMFLNFEICILPTLCSYVPLAVSK